ncbi:MAG: class I SAM-dependent methyltransferase [Bacteroidetes bacterium]|nr:class I SAM-dependent methyltransferase [Bacteroidota bacterium]
MEKLLNCPICGRLTQEPYLKTSDLSISKENFQIVKCSDCGLLFTNPRPSKKDISKYYDSIDYISHSNTKIGVFNRIYHLIRKISIKNKIKLIAKYSNGDQTILDIGSGTGEFILECSKNGWNTKGVEPNETARNFSINSYRLNVFNESYLETISPNSTQIITMWHVLEHVHDLKKRVFDIHRILKPGGTAIIAVPNPDSYDAQYYQSFWAAYDLPRHLYHFTENTIKKLFDDQGLKHITSLGMKYDSYYVSTLSEKYKNRWAPLCGGFITGIKSNLKTKGNPEKYSSVIYIFEKK